MSAITFCFLLCVVRGFCASISFLPLADSETGLIVVTVNDSLVKDNGTVENGTVGGLCPDGLTFREANVVCRQLGRGLSKYLYPIRFDSELIPSEMHVIKINRCFGNETNISQCRTTINASGVSCKSEYTMSITCTKNLPDIETDVYLVETTNYLMQAPLYILECSLEEHCLSPSAMKMAQSSDPSERYYNQRFLLRFTSVIKNVGTAPFLPLLQKHQWRFHACHQHYHSMPDFARYMIWDKRGNKIAAGHKSSFCLEDSECESGIKEKFQCSHVASNYGDQGISPGCLDAYFHDYDCQWVDITDLKYGNYIFQMIINPGYLVAESNYANNAIECNFFYYRQYGFLRRCFTKHPLELAFS